MQIASVIAGRYRVEQRAYEGGMGSVYVGRDLHTDELVGIKVLLDPDSDEALTRFTSEAQALAALRHPGIVRYHTHGLMPSGEPYLIMEWLRGEDLAQRLRYGPLSVADTLRIGIRVSEALAAAHRHDIIHRDVKPSNLFLPDGDLERITVVDFGLARKGRSIDERTPAGKLLGTPEYMAPEQARGDRALDQRADIYSIGAVLFACLTQRSPFTGSHVTAILAKVLFEEPPRVSDLRVGVPAPLDELLGRLLAKQPDERPAQASNIVDSLTEIYDSLDSDGRVRITPPAITTGEQRFSTVLLMQAPPGSRREYREGPLARAARIYGARLEVMADRTIAGIFSERGKPVEAAVRAARCALSLQAEVGMGAMVLATGRAVVTDRLPVGPVIDRAVAMLVANAGKRMPADSRPGGGRDDIVIDDATAGLLGRRFAIASCGPRRYRLLGGGDETSTGSRLLGVTTPCVGRRRELSMLLGMLDECTDESSARAALITGESGVGKSRLVSELTNVISAEERDVAIWLGRGDWLRSGASCGLLAEVLRHAIGLAEGQPVEERQRRIHDRVSDLVPAVEAKRVAAFLGEIVHAPFPAEDNLQLAAARQDPQVMHDQMRRAFLDWLGAETAQRPVLIVLDDLHWGDLPTIRFLDVALRTLRARPLMVMALAQPRVKRLFPDLFASRGVENLVLRPLPERACRSLVEHVFTHADDVSEPISDSVVARIIERSEGNALFLEELIRQVALSDHDQLPETVLALAETRLAALPAEARRVLRAASVFGRNFWRSGVGALLGDAMNSSTLDDILYQLVEQEFIVEQRSSRFNGELEYRFASELTREVAYGTLTGEDLAHGHARAGRWLDSKGEPEHVVLAEHFRRGQAVEQAIECYRRAAEQALEASDTDAVLSYVAQAVECGASGPVLGALRLLEAEAHNWRNQPDAARLSSFEAMRLLPRGSTGWANATHHAAWAHGTLGLFDDVGRLFDILLHYCRSNTPEGLHIISMAHIATQFVAGGRYEQARKIEQTIADTLAGIDADLRVIATVTHMRSFLAFFNDELDRACDLMCDAAAYWWELGDQRRSLMDSGNAGYAQYELGAYEQAVETLGAVVDDARRAGLEYLAGSHLANLAMSQAHLGRNREAERLCLDALKHYSAPRQDALSYTYLAYILLLDDRLDEASAHVERALAESEQFLNIRGLTLAVQARLLMRMNRGHEALEAAATGVALLRSLGAIEGGEGGLRLVYAEALSSAGQSQQAEAALAEALARLSERAGHISDPERRRSFLTRVPEHARTLALGRQWGLTSPALNEL